ncbi:hypothetical protein D3C85_1241810 [compost metagenome]
MQAQADDRGLAQARFTHITEHFRQASPPTATGAPDQAGRGDRAEVWQLIDVLRVAGIAQRQAAQYLACTVAHQPCRGDEARQWPVITLEQRDAGLQTLACLGLVEAVELAFPGVDPAHEVVPRRAWRRAVISMKIAMQRHFVATLQAPVKHQAKTGRMLQGIAFVKVRHHQPGHGNVAQGIDRFDERLVVRPGFRRNIMQHQQQALSISMLRHERAPASCGPALPGNVPAAR